MNAPLNQPSHSRASTHIELSAYSTKGIKRVNQDAFSYCIAKPHSHSSNFRHERASFFLIADGISSSTVSQVASDFATSHFTKMFNLAPEVWDIEQTAKALIIEINALLWARNQQSAFCYTPEKGYVCTFSAVVIVDNTLHIFHVGDCEVQIATSLVCKTLTRGHRQPSTESPDHSYLANALGISSQIAIDYSTLTLSERSSIALSSDGVFEFTSISDALREAQTFQSLPDEFAKQHVNRALDSGSDDNATLLVITVTPNFVSTPDVLSAPQSDQVLHLTVGDSVDGLIVKRQLYTSARSHVYLATSAPGNKENETSGRHQHVLKTLATDFITTDKPTTLDCTLLPNIESWLARRIDCPHIIKHPLHVELGFSNPPSKQYCLSQYVEGQTLAQWMMDNETPSLEQVRSIIEQVATGLQSMHRQGIVHRDIRPENIIINPEGHCTLIDLGAACLLQAPSLYHRQGIPGTALYAAPEYFLGEAGSVQSDQYSLAVLCYVMLCGRYPYNNKVAHGNTYAAQYKLKYQSVLDAQRPIPNWVDMTLRRALHINPTKRFAALSEFVHALRYPTVNQQSQPVPLVRRSPLAFYQALSLALVISNLITLVLIYST